MNTRISLLHLSLIDGIGPAKIKQIFDGTQNNVGLTDLSTFLPSDFIHQFGFNSVLSQKIVKGLADSALVEKELALIEKHAISWVTIADEAYPALLKAIYTPPAVLYYQGALLPDNSTEHPKTIAIVGARKADQYGQRVIDQLVPSLVAHDWTIVSGGALGADTMAHRATVAAGGKTIAVLGSGLLQPYPYSNKKLFESIIQGGGAVVSSFPLKVDPLPGNFPARNRIIAGLSRGCVVVQAAIQSGARITAQFALEQSREVFAVPGILDDPLSAGCNALIQEGAKLITSADDILVEFGYIHQKVAVPPSARVEQKQVNMPLFSVSPAYDSGSPEGLILGSLAQRTCSVDDLMGATNLSLVDLNARLFDLQIAGVITQNFAGQWEKSG